MLRLLAPAFASIIVASPAAALLELTKPPDMFIAAVDSLRIAKLAAERIVPLIRFIAPTFVFSIAMPPLLVVSVTDAPM
jgi:hypothetical protein